MKYLLPLTLLVLAACAHTPRQPPTSGFFGVVHPHKPVYCAKTDDASGLSPAECQVVQDQIRVINRAVGFELLHYAGWLTLHSSADVPAKCVDLVLVGTSPLPGSAIGMTLPRCMQGAYISGTVILLDPFIWDAQAMRGALPEDVVLHELLHALGLGHADKDGAFPSIMQPSASAELHGLQPGDLASLRAVYK